MTPEQLKESRRILKDVKDSERVGEYPYAREVLKLGFYCISAMPEALDEIERLRHGQVFAWVVGNGKEPPSYRTWGLNGPAWTEDIKEAVQFFRKQDAECVFYEDEDAWTITRHEFTP